MSLPADNREAAEVIHRLYLQRKRHFSNHISQMNEVRAVYHNSVNLPLPELDKMEKPEIPNLVAQGIDQTSMRIASVMPDIAYPSVRPGFQWADNKAADSREANLGVFHYCFLAAIVKESTPSAFKTSITSTNR